jgi:hypothetical protein
MVGRGAWPPSNPAAPHRMLGHTVREDGERRVGELAG